MSLTKEDRALVGDPELLEFASYLWRLWRTSGSPWWDNMPQWNKLPPPSTEGRGRQKLTFLRFAKKVWDQVLCDECRE